MNCKQMTDARRRTRLSSSRRDHVEYIYKEGVICTHWEFNSDYREGCFSCGARKFFCPISFLRRSQSRLNCTSTSAKLRLKAISWSILRSAPRKTRWEINRQAAAGNRTVLRELEQDHVSHSLPRRGTGLAHKEPRRLLTDPEFWNEFSTGALDIKIKPGKNMAKLQKSLFKVCMRLLRSATRKAIRTTPGMRI